MMMTGPYIASTTNRRARVLLTQLRRRQLDEARRGRFERSERYARRAERVRRLIAPSMRDAPAQ